jgi:outer membrane protein assembly factor BamE
VRPACRVLPVAAAFILAACGAPKLVTPYRMDIQQGNYISQEMVSELRPGMTREQVRFVLGTPLLTDIFHADRWDYIYYRDVVGREREARRIAVIFEDGKLARIVGDVVPAGPAEAPAAEPKP